MLRHIHSMLTAAAMAAFLATASVNAAPAHGGGHGSPHAGSGGARGAGGGGRGAGGGASRGGSFNGGGMSRGGSYGGGYNRGGYYGGGYNRGGYYGRGYGYPGVGIGIGLGLGLGYAYGGDAYYSGPTYIVAGSPGYAPPVIGAADGGDQPVIVAQPPAPASAGNAAVIRVRVPANADIWFDGDPTAQKGEVRDFASPPLTPGKEYSYEIRARWMEAGAPVDKTRRVVVHADDRIEVDFSKPEAIIAPTPVPPAK